MLINCEVYHVTANDDYVPRNVIVRFEPNQSVSCVLIDITDDNIFENTEMFEVVIIPPDDSNITVPDDGTTTVTIIDNDRK